MFRSIQYSLSSVVRCVSVKDVLVRRLVSTDSSTYIGGDYFVHPVDGIFRTRFVVSAEYGTCTTQHFIYRV